MCKVNIALQTLWVVVLMLYRMGFHLYGKAFALHVDNSTPKAYLCNQGATFSTFLLNMAY